LRGVLQAILDVNGDGAPRAGFRKACSREMCGEGLQAHKGAPDGIFRRVAGSDDRSLMSSGTPARQRGPII